MVLLHSVIQMKYKQPSLKFISFTNDLFNSSDIT